MRTSSAPVSSSGRKNAEVTRKMQALSIENGPTKNGTMLASMSSRVSKTTENKNPDDQIAQLKTELASAQLTIFEKDLKIGRYEILLKSSGQTSNQSFEIDKDYMIRMLEVLLQGEIRKRMYVELELRCWKKKLEIAGESITTDVELLKIILEYLEDLLANDEEELMAMPALRQARKQRRNYLISRFNTQNIAQMNQPQRKCGSNEKTEEESELVPTQSIQVEATSRVVPREFGEKTGNDVGHKKKRRRSRR